MRDLYDSDVEQYLLGACLVDVDAFRTVRMTLNAADFGLVPHQLLFEAIQTVFDSKETTDPVLVSKELQRMGELKRVGGWVFIHDIYAPVVETVSVGHYAEIVKELSVKRKIAGIAVQASKLVYNDNMSSVGIMTKILSELEDVDFDWNGLESDTARGIEEMELPPVKWIVPGLLPSGLAIVAGAPKIGKSFFCWNLAMAVATGGIALSSIEIETPRNVIYVALEDSLDLLQERIKMLSEKTAPTNLHAVTNFKGLKLDRAGLKILEHHVDMTDAEFIIIDTWMHVSPDSDYKGSAYDIDYKALIPVQEFAIRKNIALLLVTHTRKATDPTHVFNQIQGSVGMQASCDTLMMLTKESGVHLLNIAGRRVQQDEFALTMSDGIFILEGTVEEHRLTSERSEIIQLLHDAGELGMAAGDIVEDLGKSKSSVNKLLRTMLKSEQIYQPKPRENYYHMEFASKETQEPLIDEINL